MAKFKRVQYLLGFVGSIFFLVGCATTKNGGASGSKGVEEREEAGDRGQSSKSREVGGSDKVSSNAKSIPTPQSSVTYMVTTFSNEETFAGQVYQPRVEDVLRELEQTYRERNDDGGALISYLVFRRISGVSRDFQSVLEKRGSTASSKDPWILLECSYTALLRRDFGMAQFLLDSAESVGRGKAKVAAAVLHARGLMFYLQKKTVLAMAAFREGAKLSYEPSIMTLTMFALKTGDHSGALAQLSKIKDRANDDLNVKAALGIAYRQAGKPDEAIPYLNAVVKARPNDRRALWNAALAASEIPSKRKEAIALLQKYSSSPGALVDIDYKARELLSSLQAKEDALRTEEIKDKAASGQRKSE